MTLWQELETWLFDMYDEHGPKFRFTSHTIQDDLKVSGYDASTLIQSYLEAQRRPDSETLFVLKREGRTSAAIWSMGIRTADARAMGNTLYRDITVKVKRAYAPDMKRLAMRNPKAAKFVNQKIDHMVPHALALIAESLDSYFDDDDEE
jgi:hypothetical protein